MLFWIFSNCFVTCLWKSRVGEFCSIRNSLSWVILCVFYLFIDDTIDLQNSIQLGLDRENFRNLNWLQWQLEGSISKHYQLLVFCIHKRDCIADCLLFFRLLMRKKARPVYKMDSMNWLKAWYLVPIVSGIQISSFVKWKSGCGLPKCSPSLRFHVVSTIYSISH